ncbi:hypothetical protein Mal15_26150 [Stieleria maiorica]|uniref:NADH:ubiquinone oxidoreductase intermediate-associated protein 30 domain-containing protein n=2 Tax=Stieleria maiorica TaxID=2795974 RepID=A0A5B9MCQ9_9BACT|nr:hypothetical protein Mal15_26150 [Stieleria maiorica]
MADSCGTSWSTKSRCVGVETDTFPSQITHRLKAVVGPEGKPGFTPIRVSPINYAPGDPEFRAPEGASLQFEIKTDSDETFDVKLHKNYWVDDFSTYSAKVSIKGDNGWQTVTLSGAEFRNSKTDEPLGKSINEIGVLEITMPRRQGWSDPQVMFRNSRWVGGKYVPHVHAYRQK